MGAPGGPPIPGKIESEVGHPPGPPIPANSGRGRPRGMGIGGSVPCIALSYSRVYDSARFKLKDHDFKFIMMLTQKALLSTCEGPRAACPRTVSGSQGHSDDPESDWRSLLVGEAGGRGRQAATATGTGPGSRPGCRNKLVPGELELRRPVQEATWSLRVPGENRTRGAPS